MIKRHTYKLPSWSHYLRIHKYEQRKISLQFFGFSDGVWWLSEGKSIISIGSIDRKHIFLLCKDNLTPKKSEKGNHHKLFFIIWYLIPQTPYKTKRRTVGQDHQKCQETSSPLADKQQKTGEHNQVPCQLSSINE